MTQLAALFESYQHQLEMPVDDSNEFLGVEWTACGPDLFLRRRGAPDEEVWCYLHRGGIGERLLEPRRHLRARTHLAKLQRARSFWRYWRLENGDELFLRSKFGLVRLAGTDELARYELPERQREHVRLWDTIEGSALKVETELLAADPQSDLNAARNWLQLHPTDRPWLMLNWARGCRADFQPLLRAILQLCEPPNNTDCWSYPMDIGLPGAIKLKLPMHGFLDTGPRMQATRRLLVLLNQHFKVERSAEKWRGYDLYGSPETARPVVFHVSRPSMHEKLEAMMLLRSWLIGKVPEAQVAELVGS